MPVTDEAVRRTARVLTRFMSQAEANGFAQGYVLDSQPFLSEWQKQQAFPLAPSYTAPAIGQLPAAATAHVGALKAMPLFAQIYGANAEIKMVDLGKLIACQMWVDTDVSGGLIGTAMQATPAFDEILNTCLPPTIVTPAPFRAQPVPNGLIAFSMNNTFVAQGPGFDPATGQVTFALTAGANLMFVREHAGRYVLANGYHRAWLLRSRGVTTVPAVVTSVATREALIPGAGFFQPALLFGARPPIVDDFLDGALSVAVEVRSMMKAVRITAESLLVPRLLL